MLFRREILQAIAQGRVTLAFRRWTRPSVRAGTRLRTAIGEVLVTGMTAVAEAAISEGDAQAAGFVSRVALFESLEGRAGTLYRIELEYGGADRRVALRANRPSRSEMAAVLETVARMDRARAAPWTLPILSLIGENPGVRAADLAAQLKREIKAFKTDVRKLKELGLTESLAVGYRLSPRGKAVLRKLRGES